MSGEPSLSRRSSWPPQILAEQLWLFRHYNQTETLEDFGGCPCPVLGLDSSPSRPWLEYLIEVLHNRSGRLVTVNV